MNDHLGKRRLHMSIQASDDRDSGPVAFAVSVRPDRDTIHVTPAGELDIATVGELRRAVQELVDAGFAHVVIDLRELDFIDCSGLELLLELERESRRDGWRLSLVQGSAAVQSVFVVTESSDALPFEPG
jgi:anti-anti-sigma factor